MFMRVNLKGAHHVRPPLGLEEKPGHPGARPA